MGRGSDPDGIAVARLQGAVSYTYDRKMDHADAVAHLRAISERPDLLAEAAGIIAGASTQSICHRPTEMRNARRLVEAGADRVLLPRWIRQGIENAGRGKLWGRAGAVFVAPQELVDETVTELLEGLPEG